MAELGNEKPTPQGKPQVKRVSDFKVSPSLLGDNEDIVITNSETEKFERQTALITGHKDIDTLEELDLFNEAYKLGTKALKLNKTLKKHQSRSVFGLIILGGLLHYVKSVLHNPAVKETTIEMGADEFREKIASGVAIANAYIRVSITALTNPFETVKSFYQAKKETKAILLGGSDFRIDIPKNADNLEKAKGYVWNVPYDYKEAKDFVNIGSEHGFRSEEAQKYFYGVIKYRNGLYAQVSYFGGEAINIALGKAISPPLMMLIRGAGYNPGKTVINSVEHLYFRTEKWYNEGLQSIVNDYVDMKQQIKNKAQDLQEKYDEFMEFFDAMMTQYNTGGDVNKFIDYVKSKSSKKARNLMKDFGFDDYWNDLNNQGYYWTKEPLQITDLDVSTFDPTKLKEEHSVKVRKTEKNQPPPKPDKTVKALGKSILLLADKATSEIGDPIRNNRINNLEKQITKLQDTELIEPEIPILKEKVENLQNQNFAIKQIARKQPVKTNSDKIPNKDKISQIFGQQLNIGHISANNKMLQKQMEKELKVAVNNLADDEKQVLKKYIEVYKSFQIYRNKHLRNERKKYRQQLEDTGIIHMLPKMKMKGRSQKAKQYFRQQLNYIYSLI